MIFETHYAMKDNVVNRVDIVGDGLRVSLEHQRDGDYKYLSWDRNETIPVVAAYTMSLPTGLLHAAQFFGMLPPGTITEDVYNGCEYEF